MDKNPEVDTTDIKRIAEAYSHRVWNKKDISAINELIDPNLAIHSPLGDFQGRESLKKIVQEWLKGFPDLFVINTATVCEHDLVVMQWKAQGSHRAEFRGMPPSGKSIAYNGVTIYRIRDGKITEYWTYLDMQHLLNQLS